MHTSVSVALSPSGRSRRDFSIEATITPTTAHPASVSAPISRSIGLAMETRYRRGILRKAPLLTELENVLAPRRPCYRTERKRYGLFYTNLPVSVREIFSSGGGRSRMHDWPAGTGCLAQSGIGQFDGPVGPQSQPEPGRQGSRVQSGLAGRRHPQRR